MTKAKRKKRRTNAQVEAVKEAAREELEVSHPMTLRQIHYRLVSRDDIVHPNTQAAYNSLSNWLRDDRLEGRIPWHWMEDRLRRARGWSMWEDPKSFLEDTRSRYRRNLWGEQERYCEVWLEKDALSGSSRARSPGIVSP